MIYLDHSATTPVDPDVLEIMLPLFLSNFGNPSGSHQLSRKAASLISNSRIKIANFLSCNPKEIIFTSSGTESNNFAIRGVVERHLKENKPFHLITSAADHPSVIKTMEQLSLTQAIEYTVLPIEKNGSVNPDELERAIKNNTLLISITYASNEVGTIQPIRELANIAHNRSILFHTDAVQGGNYLNLDVKQLSIDMLSLSGHKIYGPKGIGVLYVKEGTLLMPQLFGGSQENNQRAGTENVPNIIGFASALEKAHQRQEKDSHRLRQLSEKFVQKIIQTIPDALHTGDSHHRIPGHVSLIFKNIQADILLMHLDMEGVFASSGSACATGNPEPSPTLLAMNYSPQDAKGSLRFSMGRSTTWEELDHVIHILNRVVNKLRFSGKN